MFLLALLVFDGDARLRHGMLLWRGRGLSLPHAKQSFYPLYNVLPVKFARDGEKRPVGPVTGLPERA